MAREVVTEAKINILYTVEHVYEEQGFPSIIDVQKTEVNGKQIELVEEPTGKKASLTAWDKEEGVEAGEVVKLHILVDGEEVTTADEIWLSNRQRGSRYFSWLDIVTVNDDIAIIQRLTDDDHMGDRKWKIIWLYENGKFEEEVITYEARGENPLAVKLIDVSGTSLMSMGYYSDLLKGYPSIPYPFLYPFGTGFVGLMLCVFYIKRRNQIK